MNVPFASVLPRVQHADRRAGHHYRVRLYALAVKRRLDEAALALPEVSLACQQAPSEDARQGPVVCGLRKISRVCDQHGFYVARMHDHINRNMSEMHANHIPVLLSTTFVKPQLIA